MKRVTWTGIDSLDYTEDAPLPGNILEKGEVLVRISAIGLCGTDVHIIEGKLRF